jgi:hypothetical protein
MDDYGMWKPTDKMKTVDVEEIDHVQNDVPNKI